MPDTSTDRAKWVTWTEKIARPILTAMSRRQLKAKMPVEVAPDGNSKDRAKYTHLEAIGRLLDGIAPWLELPADDSAEGKMRGELAQLACNSIDAATDPKSPDYCNFKDGKQPLVDAAFLAQALMR